MHTRRSFLRTMGGLAAAAALPAAGRPPNFVVLFTDDQRFDTLSALGHPEVRTPNMDRLVRSGVAFTHACTQGGLVGAICMPSRAQLMTGRSLFRVHDHIISRQNNPDPAIPTFPELLRKAGYVTFGTGKWHNGRPLYHRSFSAGGNIFFGGMHDQTQTPVMDYDPSGRYPAEKARPTPRYSSEAFSDAGVKFLKERDRSKPYLLYVAYSSPHDPRTAPKRFTDSYPPGKVTLPENFLPEHPIDTGNLRGRDEMLAGFPRMPAEVRRHIAEYYAMISEVDSQIGRVLDAVEESGDAANTYIVFAGDNGLAVGQHGLFGKQNLYDHSLRVPLVITGPGIPKGQKRGTLCHIMDICPTILELGGITAPPNLDGRSLKPAFSNPGASIHDAVIAAHRNFQRGIRTDRWKLIFHNVDGQRPVQLFDLRNDPLERKNLADDEGQAARIRELKSLLQRMLKDAGDRVNLDAAEWPA